MSTYLSEALAYERMQRDQAEAAGATRNECGGR
jgi:hypothetical protein